MSDEVTLAPFQQAAVDLIVRDIELLQSLPAGHQCLGLAAMLCQR